MTQANTDFKVSKGALAGLKVVELGQLIAGPFAAKTLADFGVAYAELPLDDQGLVDRPALKEALAQPTRMVLIQRSCGYSWRPSLGVDEIGELCEIVKAIQPGCVCFVDNCYGELVQAQEPTAVGADLIAGSLIKNLGGTIAPTGGYVAGRADLVEMACCRLTAPGIGSEGGTGFDLHRLLFQGPGLWSSQRLWVYRVGFALLLIILPFYG